jgi:predicted GIY-YIG superfamily endonuclease
VHYVYLIESTATPGERHIGMTKDIRRRLQDHDTGKSSHTSRFRPFASPLRA